MISLTYSNPAELSAIYDFYSWARIFPVTQILVRRNFRNIYLEDVLYLCSFILNRHPITLITEDCKKHACCNDVGTYSAFYFSLTEICIMEYTYRLPVSPTLTKEFVVSANTLRLQFYRMQYFQATQRRFCLQQISVN